MEEIVKQIRKEAEKYFEDMPPSHDWSHVERVYDSALKIAEIEGGDFTIIRLAALLHDIGRKQETQNSELDHAKISTEFATEILDRYHINGKIKEQVLHCISSHRFRKEEKPETLEAKIIFDADKLDCIGAIGIARAYAWAGEQKIKLYSDKSFLGTGYEKEHSPVTEFLYKLSKVKDRMQTKTGRKMAEERHNYIANYFNQLNTEIGKHEKITL